MINKIYVFTLALFLVLTTNGFSQKTALVLNEQEYFEMPGLNVMLFHDVYPEGHQSGVSIIQNGVRVASNGDVRLEPTPGQWQPTPKVGKRIADKENLSLHVPCSFPNPKLDRKGFNPIIYPDLKFGYKVNVKAEGKSVRVTVDLEEALPEEWIGKIGFNLELFPGHLFGKSYYMDEQSGIFSRQLNGPMVQDENGSLEVKPLAEGSTLVIAPEIDAQRMTITALKGRLQLIDGRAHHNNGWFVVRSVIPESATKAAVEWVISPNAIPNWKYETVIHLSQVGYHTNQKKIAVLECDPAHKSKNKVKLKKVMPSGELKTVLSTKPQNWGKFLRYQYFLFDFSKVKEAGMYQVAYGDKISHVFKIGDDVFDRHVWQPTLEYFLPVQMCHVRVNDRYRVWHGLCHLDDALMAPTDTIHFDGYRQSDSTLTKYKSLDPVPGLNVGGWHDAGDYDLRVESQAGTVHMLSLIYEVFGVDYDETTVDQLSRVVELHRPDGKPDVLQQIEHGVLTILAGYKSLGRLYRGIICSQLRQYVMLGDGSTMTDNRVYDPSLGPHRFMPNESGIFDDRWVFTEENPGRALTAAAGLAAASRVLRGYNDELAQECLEVAEAVYAENKDSESRRARGAKVQVLAELILATEKDEYKTQLKEREQDIEKMIGRVGWALGRIQSHMDEEFNKALTEAVRGYNKKLNEDIKETPFGVPYRPRIWGAGWDIQRFGYQQYFWHKGWPDIISKEPLFSALNFVLGCHPGINTASFASGVGSNSVTAAYGVNRADWSYIPGGVASGTALIRPDLAEMKEWPFFWQQTEYVVGGGGSNFMFLVLAANKLMKESK